ncbi:MAG: hypothetical protein HQL94_02010 [Magnetococcales bacterium]|nr:hypothetical protein [Magnetococcales bacterium]MBF0438971.1 hypothetical protein [Magnetococcales bacterium]
MHAKTLPGKVNPHKPKAVPFRLLTAMPYMAKLAIVSKRWKREVFGSTLLNLQPGSQSVLVRGTRECPDGQKPHPTVCHRGWRGDLCHGCSVF